MVKSAGYNEAMSLFILISGENRKLSIKGLYFENRKENFR